jgi:small subunit ribosomal protein S4
MARYVDASCKLCRREKQKLFLKGTKCLTEKCPLEKRTYAPGQHGQSQFRNYFERAAKQSGRTGDALIKLLERRLDNVVYRLGFAPSRKSARQLILHRHLLVNNQIVDVPSFLLNPGDVIQIRENSKKLALIHDSLKRVKDASMLVWLTVDKATLSGTFVSIPERADIPLNANEQLIVELYSK